MNIPRRQLKAPIALRFNTIFPGATTYLRNTAPCSRSVSNQVESASSQSLIGKNVGEQSSIMDIKQGGHLHIIGAGISGLTLAWFVSRSRPDINVTISEANNRTGGWMDSRINEDGSVLEYGPRTLLSSSPSSIAVLKMLQQIGMEKSIRGIPVGADVNARAVSYGNDLVKLPTNIWETLKFSLHPLGRGLLWEVLVEPFRSRRDVGDESVDAFIERKFGKKFKTLSSALMRGIYGGDSGRLSSEFCAQINKLRRIDNQGKSILDAMITGEVSHEDKINRENIDILSDALVGKLRSPTNHSITPENLKKNFSLLLLEDGIQSMAKALQRDLEKCQNVKLLLNTPVDKIVISNAGCSVEYNSSSARPDLVVSTISAQKLAEVIVSDPPITAACKELEYTSIAVVSVESNSLVMENWFGFLVPKGQELEEKIIGIIFDSAVRKGSIPLFSRDESDRGKSVSDTSVLTVMMGGHLWNGIQIPDNETIIEMAKKGLKAYFPDMDIDSSYLHCELQRNCILQPTVGHRDRMRNIKNAVSKASGNKLLLSGSSFGRGVGLGDVIFDSILIASALSGAGKQLPEWCNQEIAKLTQG